MSSVGVVSTMEIVENIVITVANYEYAFSPKNFKKAVIQEKGFDA